MYAVVWGFASTGSAVGVLSMHETRALAQAACAAARKANDNPACGHWVVSECHICGRVEGGGCHCH